MDLTAATITIGSVITVGMFLIALSNFFSGRKKSTKDDEARLVRIEAGIARIEQNTSDIKTKQEEHEHRLQDHDTRITVVETKLKSYPQRR